MTEYILLSGIIVSVFVSLLMLQKRNKSAAEILLLLLLSSTSYLIFSYLLVYNGSYLKYPKLTVLGFSFPLLSAPLMYLYIKYQTKPIFFHRIDLLHFLPFIISNLLFIKFYFLPFESEVDILKNNGAAFEMEGLIKLVLIYLSGIFYITWSFISLYYHKTRLNKEFSNSDRINFNWLLLLNIGLLVIWVAVIFIQDDKIIFSYSSLYIICIGFFGLTQVKVFTEKDVLYIQKQNSLDNLERKEISIGIKETKPNDGNLQEIYIKVVELLKKEKLYLNPELKIIDLAILLNIHPNLMSRAINHVSQATFYDLINKMRVDEFINNIKGADANKYTIIAIAFDSGFNSKATFNRNFKAIRGMSPSEFLLSLQKEGIN